MRVRAQGKGGWEGIHCEFMKSKVSFDGWRVGPFGRQQRASRERDFVSRHVKKSRLETGIFETRLETQGWTYSAKSLASCGLSTRIMNL